MFKTFLFSFCLFYLGSGNVRCTGGGISHPPNQSSPELLITPGMNLTQINNVISQASFGDTVNIESGTYTIDGKINMVPGVTLNGISSTKPIFDATSQSDRLFEIVYETTNVSHCTFQNIAFYNIKMKFDPTTHYAIQNIVFDNCLFDYGKRAPGTDEKSSQNDGYIVYLYIKDSSIKNCTFLRREGNDGRGVYNKYTENNIIEYNNWGGSDPSVTGFFVTALNERGTNTIIRNNTIVKHPTWAPLAHQDHGIYALDFNGVTITDNTISGWPANGSGGAVKARNGQNLTITNNTMETSGVLLYTYSTDKIQQHLKNVVIKDNKINIWHNDGTAGIYLGIGYYTNANYQNEYSIRIEGNTITNGYCVAKNNKINADGFSTSGGGFYNNTCSEIHIKLGMSHSDNNATIVEY